MGSAAIDVGTHEGVGGEGVSGVLLEEVGEDAERVVEGEKGGEGEGEELGGEEGVVDEAGEDGLGEDLVEAVDGIGTAQECFQGGEVENGTHFIFGWGH